MKFIKSNIKKILKRTPLLPVLKEIQYAKYLYTIRKQLSKAESNKAAKPNVINLNANDICNSKCTMCNIWEQKLQYQYTPAQLEQMLKDPLYTDVKFVGITGGEPTLREDLPELYQAVINAIPGVVGLSIITNAIKQNEVIERIDRVIETCEKNGKSFGMMVSVDGYGKMHDTVRGREGNFETAIEVINYFKNKNINILIGATISKINVWEIDELLLYMKKNGLHGRFRVAEFIKRLYNDNRSEVIRNFTEDEQYHLLLFFYKLIYTFEKDENINRTYKSIIEVLSGNSRLIGCPYQREGVNVNSKGEIAYCAPKSPVIGSGMENSSLELFRENIQIRDDIRANDCDNCIHDYHHPITLREFNLKVEEDKWRALVNLSNKKVIKKAGGTVPEFLQNKNKKAFIVGWYGTETVGDKAILAGIVQDLQRKHPNIQIIVGSLFPHITVRTLKELNIQADIVFDYSAAFEQSARLSDITIMGGGPLMDLDELSVPLHAFRIAHKNNKQTIVYGCGLGPLYKEECVTSVKEILQLADQIMLRDKGSVLLAEKWGFTASLSGDFAKHYLQTTYPNQTKQVKKGLINCYLREWTSEYYNEEEKLSFERKKEAFEKGLVAYLKSQIETLQATELCLQNMHNFVVGNDDRDFSRYFIDKYFKDYTGCIISYDKKLSTVESIVSNMHEAELNVCMRFHSVLFAHTLNTNFVAIDYTLGGKINNYLNDNNQSEKLISIAQLSALSL